jgi:hypothetical protein
MTPETRVKIALKNARKRAGRSGIKDDHLLTETIRNDAEVKALREDPEVKEFLSNHFMEKLIVNEGNKSVDAQQREVARLREECRQRTALLQRALMVFDPRGNDPHAYAARLLSEIDLALWPDTSAAEVSIECWEAAASWPNWCIYERINCHEFGFQGCEPARLRAQ